MCLVALQAGVRAFPNRAAVVFQTWQVGKGLILQRDKCTESPDSRVESQKTRERNTTCVCSDRDRVSVQLKKSKKGQLPHLAVGKRQGWRC